MHALALLRIGEQLREPRDRRDELDADADERAAAPEQQPSDRRGVAGGQRRKRVEQDAPHEHAAAAEQVGQVPAEQAEDAARDRRNIEQRSRPTSLTARLSAGTCSSSASAGRTMSGSISSS